MRGPANTWFHRETTVIRVPAVLAGELMADARERDRTLIKAKIDALRQQIVEARQELAALVPSRSQQKKRRQAVKKRRKAR